MDNYLVGQRIKEARTLRNMTLDDVADDIGVAKSTVQRYENGKIARVKLPVLQAIANTLRVNPVWLCGQDVPMCENNEPSKEEPQPVEPQFSNSEIDLIEKYRFLDEHGKDMVDTVMEKEYARCKDEEENVITIDEETLRSMTFEDRLRFIGSEEVIALRPVARRRNK